jgi:hypothetical protein
MYFKPYIGHQIYIDSLFIVNYSNLLTVTVVCDDDGIDGAEGAPIDSLLPYERDGPRL